MKKIVTIIIAILLLNSCKKEEPKQYSHWTVNGQEYSSNNIEFNVGKEIAIIGSKDPNNWFKLTFYGYYSQNASNIRLKRDNLSLNPNFTVLSFFVNNKYYGIDNDTTLLHNTIINGKASYRLYSTWYSHYENGIKDSVLIEGIFNEP